MKKVILSTAYFAPTSWYVALLKAEQVELELNENFTKQTFRNRTVIMGGNNTLNLIVPKVKNSERVNIREIEIDYSADWRKLHLKSIATAYRSSPYFEFYEHEIKEFYEQKLRNLLELNQAAHQLVCSMLNVGEIELPGTQQPYVKEYLEPEVTDLRYQLTPKKESLLTSQEEYTQVFFDRMPFVKDLSILDVIFNLGPASMDYLKRQELGLLN